MKTTPQLFCVAEDWMLLEGGVLYGFTRFLNQVDDTENIFYEQNIHTVSSLSFMVGMEMLICFKPTF